MKKILLVVCVFLTLTTFAQTSTDTIRGYVQSVDYTNPSETRITIYKNSTGELLNVSTPNYIRLQTEFFIDGDVSLYPPPLHVTDIWTEDNTIYFTTSEPVRDIVLWLREYRWDGFETSGNDITEHDYWKWMTQVMSLSSYKTSHSITIPRETLGINWSWNLIIAIENANGDKTESKMIRFKTNGKMFQY